MSNDDNFESFFNYVKNKYPIIINFLLVGVGIYLFLNLYFPKAPIETLLLFITTTFSMYLIIQFWRWFTPQYSPTIIHYTTAHKWIRKIIAGGTYSYYEYKENPEKIGILEPIFRFLNLMIAFLGLAATISKITKFYPTSPVENLYAVIIWLIILFIVPFVLTPIIPVIWAMEDLGLKAWNERTKENWKISARYKRRFNSIIALGTISIGLTLNRVSNNFIDNLIHFAGIVLNGIIILVYPVSVLTLLYYLYFRKIIQTKVRSRMNIETGRTALIIVNPKSGKPIKDSLWQFSSDNETEIMLAENKTRKMYGGEAEPIQIENQNLFTKINKRISTLGRDISNATLGKILKKNLKEEKNVEVDESKEIGNKEKKGYRYKSGSATRGLWDHDDDN